jgi:hypothetical protein
MSRIRSAIGKEIDMSALASKHEHVRAAGNMGVNARGDIIDSKNQVIMDNNQRIGSVYNKTVANKMHSVVSDTTQQIDNKKSELIPDEPIYIAPPVVNEEPDIISPEEMELLHDDSVAEDDDFSIDDIVKVVNQKP